MSDATDRPPLAVTPEWLIRDEAALRARLADLCERITRFRALLPLPSSIPSSISLSDDDLTPTARAAGLEIARASADVVGAMKLLAARVQAACAEDTAATRRATAQAQQLAERVRGMAAEQAAARGRGDRRTVQRLAGEAARIRAKLGAVQRAVASHRVAIATMDAHYRALFAEVQAVIAQMRALTVPETPNASDTPDTVSPPLS